MGEDFDEPEPDDDDGFLTPDIPIDDDLEFDDDTDRDTGFRTLLGIVNTYSAYMCWSPATLLQSGQITLDLPSDYLPFTTKVLNGFENDILLTICLELSDYDWHQPPALLDLRHPVHGTDFRDDTFSHHVCVTFSVRRIVHGVAIVRRRFF
jgi:hypothetical protein